MPIRFVVLLAIMFAFAGPARAGGAIVNTGLSCIKSIRATTPLRAGIHTGKLAKTVVLQDCKGGFHILSKSAGKVRVVKTSPARTAHPPKLDNINPLRDGRVTFGTNAIGKAWLTRPTRRYGHAVLGDAIEAGGFAIETKTGQSIDLTLPSSSVFEDRIVRVLDLAGNGSPQLVVIRSYLDRGAALAVYALSGGRLVHLAETPAIGIPNRWLNVAAAGDFNGDGRTEIAWVQTPHIGGILKVAKLEQAGGKFKLKIIGQIGHFSNHAIGSRDLLQSVTFDWNGDKLPDIILPGPAQRTLKVVSMKGRKLKVIASFPLQARMVSQLVAADLDSDGRGEALVLLNTGKLYAFSPSP